MYTYLLILCFKKGEKCGQTCQLKDMQTNLFLFLIRSLLLSYEMLDMNDAYN